MLNRLYHRTRRTQWPQTILLWARSAIAVGRSPKLSSIGLHPACCSYGSRVVSGWRSEVNRAASTMFTCTAAPKSLPGNTSATNIRKTMRCFGRPLLRKKMQASAAPAIAPNQAGLIGPLCRMAELFRRHNGSGVPSVQLFAAAAWYHKSVRWYVAMDLQCGHWSSRPLPATSGFVGNK